MSLGDANNFIVPVLAGGGTRLPAHVGIITALKKLNLNYNHIVGILAAVSLLHWLPVAVSLKNCILSQQKSILVNLKDSHYSV